MINNLIHEIDGINLIDIGSSGNLDKKWHFIRPYINLVGFDPNKKECERMAGLQHNFKSVKYIPYAISGENAENTLYKTKSIYCYSLLEPNTEWLRRFSFSHLFERVGEEPLLTRTLADIPEVEQLDVDVIKTDTQGLELPILKHADNALKKAFMVETETGFVENYIGETTYAQIDEFMRSKSFLLFDINTSHRIARNNVFKDSRTGAEQLLWCEAVWLKDYVALAKNNKLSKEEFGREKVLKILILCGLQGCIDYGLEIATLFYDMSYLTSAELTALQTKEGWAFNGVQKANSGILGNLINYSLRLLPKRIRREIRRQSEHLAK